jgi:hypothetical protein
VAFRFVAAKQHPDHDTIAPFRRRFLPRTLRPAQADSRGGEWSLVTTAWNMKRMFVLAGAS